jgi:hypothetical protein
MSDRTWQVVVTVGAGLLALVVLRVVLGVVSERAVRRAAARKSPDHAARLRTRLMVLRRVILAFVFAVVLWSVLEIFPATEQIARTLLASSAFLALVIGVAFTVSPSACRSGTSAPASSSASASPSASATGSPWAT